MTIRVRKFLTLGTVQRHCEKFYRLFLWLIIATQVTLYIKHRENMSSAKLPGLRMSARVNFPNFSFCPQCDWATPSWAVISATMSLFLAAFDGAFDQLQ